MVVGRTWGGFVVWVMLACPVWAQGPSLRAYVPNREIVQDRPFWLVVEASGSSVAMPRITQGDGVVINTSSPQQQRQFSIGGGVRQQTLRLSYSSTAIRAGEVVIPPVTARIDGRTIETAPITLKVTAAPDDQEAAATARAWVSDTDVTVGQPFWIYIEATGIEIRLPNTLDIESIAIDPTNMQRSTSFSFSSQGQRATEKRGFYAVAQREGTLIIPPIEVQVTGRMVKTNPIKITARKMSVPSVAPSQPGHVASRDDLTQDDLVFIEMKVDREEVYQGEPVFLSMQLWRIKHPRISSGPKRGALIESPTTEGFFVRELEPTAYERDLRGWTYDVAESRKLLYPTRTGVLSVGRWHWEGIALINRQSIVMRDKLYYKLNAGPIEIKVKPLPSAPEGFSGAVGEFSVSADVKPEVVRHGVPFELTVRVEGFGNPDAIGDPSLPEMEWASVGKFVRNFELHADADRMQPRVIKTFTCAVTPLEAGRRTVPAFEFVSFDPSADAYVSTPLGPFDLDVVDVGETPQRLMASPDLPVAERRVDILAEDIRPLIHRTRSLSSGGPRPTISALLFALPVLVYVAFVVWAMRRARVVGDTGRARSYRARSEGMRRLRGVAASPEPEDALFRAVTAFVCDTLNLSGEGMTSHDIESALHQAGLPEEASRRTVRILDACERARYASEHLTKDEMNALIHAADSCMQELDGLARSTGR